MKNLTLAGNSYISLTKANDGITSEDGVSNTGVQDVMMGQSIAVKSDQLAYLVPAQCIGVDASGKTVLNGASNPITLEQYKDKIRDQADVTEVALNIPSASRVRTDPEQYPEDFQADQQQDHAGVLLCKL